eukprot:Partr_v1_DN27712_c1_g1_i1_m67620 putative chitin synthase
MREDYEMQDNRTSKILRDSAHRMAVTGQQRNVAIADIENQSPVVTSPRSLVRRERSMPRQHRPLVAHADTRPAENFYRAPVDGGGGKGKSVAPEADQSACSCWDLFVTASTCLILPVFMRKCGKTDSKVQRAFREKIALMIIIVGFWAFLGFFTFGMQVVLCDTTSARTDILSPPDFSAFAIKGRWYSIDDTYLYGVHPVTINYIVDFRLKKFRDVSGVFANSYSTEACTAAGFNIPAQATCTVVGGYNGPCHTISLKELEGAYMRLDVSYEWNVVADASINKYIVYNGIVLDFAQYLADGSLLYGQEVHDLILKGLHSDATHIFKSSKAGNNAINCLVEKYQIGYVSKESPGCFSASVLNFITLLVIIGMIVIRFTMAIIYTFFVAPKLSRKPDPSKTYLPPGVQPAILGGASKRLTARSGKRDSFTSNGSRTSSTNFISRFSHNNLEERGIDDSIINLYATYVMMLVTCYSEDEEGIRNTLESLASTDYADANKLIFMVADGIVTGGGNAKSTPDICIGLMKHVVEFSTPEPMSYVAVAHGSKQHNMAKVYAGFFEHDSHVVPMILVVKCGTPEEAEESKPGNRGKRDSQIILMNFLSKVMFDDRMTPLEYDMFTKIQYVCNVTADRFEIVLMVDADTKVMPDSLPLMVNAMKNNTKIMGLCGETRIANKLGSWVTTIQVYEYFVSHHLAKAFESLFGGVTCLPGCFSAYRIKSPKGAGYWVPILANPEIIEEYSQNVVETLHEKNLLLLGEDRFLSTLMLKTFPKRQMIFLPQASCKTVVPDEFGVLLSQRRRWINSTVHNLMELVLVKDLCGTFCFSMQFVVALELFGTVVLPAAMIFTIVLLISIATPQESFVRESLMPLLILIAIIALPSILVILASRRFLYVFYLAIYLVALPIWNFVLPLYSFWHFDDFSWGKTRLVAGEGSSKEGGHGNKTGEFDSSQVPMKTWSEWEAMTNRSSSLMAHKKRRATPSPISTMYASDSSVTHSPTLPPSPIYNHSDIDITSEDGSGYESMPSSPVGDRLARHQRRKLQAASKQF